MTHLPGGSGKDTLTFTGAVDTALITTGAEADVFTIAAGATGTSIVAAGADSVNFSGSAMRCRCKALLLRFFRWS